MRLLVFSAIVSTLLCYNLVTCLKCYSCQLERSADKSTSGSQDLRCELPEQLRPSQLQECPRTGAHTICTSSFTTLNGNITTIRGCGFGDEAASCSTQTVESNGAVQKVCYCHTDGCNNQNADSGSSSIELKYTSTIFTCLFFTIFAFNKMISY